MADHELDLDQRMAKLEVIEQKFEEQKLWRTDKNREFVITQGQDFLDSVNYMVTADTRPAGSGGVGT